MSCNSGQSSGEKKVGGCHGVPSKCHCGKDVVFYTSNTQANPGRPFFRCPNRGDDHLFKWVEEGVYEEVVDALPKFSIIGREIEDLKERIEELKEDGMLIKRDTKKWKLMSSLCLVCLTFSVIAIVILLLKTKNPKFVLGY
ncbi:PREDICTED: uncharacterized protein At1g43920, Chloroplastic-like [Camelina sativa]|uniref:Uncharacterized protein At1g43920, Chloroplastic-like n=1 Tax=Camelina sativa TaxID=90675 RepID=A0ABM1RBF6_CAMSA|nr:PREDICTED: uncharacterized protein At1g43920, Chloroplastic-like [Camelina sativa]XP_019096335.1 PREDICTED: uncharacterized protein At1g43920, Chloroplastic-like [Camelina sativa]XP_019096344.1 PREDICTED: uncharacterized protein At1g43920, Chloroplastic-like [Camelina sativa]